MKGIVADLLVGTHLEDGLPRRLESAAMDVAVCGQWPAFRSTHYR